MKIKQTLIALAVVVGISGTLSGVWAQLASAECANVATSIISCPKSDGKTVETTGVWSLLVIVINILTAGVGVLAVGGVVYGSILYSVAGDSSEKVSKAREVIRNVVIGIIAYALMYSALNFLIPGGLFTV